MLERIIDRLIDDACDADVIGVPYWPAIEQSTLRQARQHGIRTSRDEVRHLIARTRETLNE